MLAALAVLMLQAESASMATTPTPDLPARAAVTTQPEWRQRPTWRDIDRVFPHGPRARGLSGAALMTCKVNRLGQLAECAIVQEVPPGNGFGEAALKLADKFEMRPQTKNGIPVDGGVVRIPLRFIHPNAR